jgi:uncharacterized protein
MQPRVSVAIAVLALVGTLGAGQIHQRLLEPQTDRPRYDVRVLAVGADRVVLEGTEETRQPGVWGLEWAGGYGLLGPVIHSSPRAVSREFQTMVGRLQPGEIADIDAWAYTGNPRSAHGIPFRVVDIPSTVGPLPSWFIPGAGDTWAIFVHGRNSALRETLRLLPTFYAGGYPSLVIRYRNDPGGPHSADGLYHLGETEWRDLEAAARFALGRGAEHLVLVGYSMGGNIVSQFLRRSQLAKQTEGAILDAPALDWEACVDRTGESVGVPSSVTGLSKLAFSVRFGISWEDLNELRHVEELHTPILLFHGVEDQMVPVRVSDSLARIRPDIVTYEWRKPATLKLGTSTPPPTKPRYAASSGGWPRESLRAGITSPRGSLDRIPPHRSRATASMALDRGPIGRPSSARDRPRAQAHGTREKLLLRGHIAARAEPTRCARWADRPSRWAAPVPGPVLQRRPGLRGLGARRGGRPPIC